MDRLIRFGGFSVDRLIRSEEFPANHLVRFAVFSLLLLVLLQAGTGRCQDQTATSETAISTPGDRWVSGVPLRPTEERSPFQKEPDCSGIRSYGEVDLGGTIFRFRAFAAGDDGKMNNVIFDLNQNGDLTDDPQIRLDGKEESKTLTFEEPGGRSIEARLVRGDPDGYVYSMRLCPVETHRIRVNLGGREYAAFLRDAGFDGLKQGVSTDDFMMVDLNGDGRFDDGPGGMQPEGFTYLGNLVWLNGDLWLPTLDSKTPAVSFRPYSGASGQLALEIDLPEPWKEAGLLARFTGTSGFLSSGAARTVVSLSKPAPIRLPAVSYS